MLMTMKTRKFTVTLVRHGETLDNRARIIQGQADTQLSELGQNQAKLVGARLQNERFTHMFSSNLIRAWDTAKAIVEQNTVTSCELRLDKLLRERCFGWLEGKPSSELKRLVQEQNVSIHEFTPEGGETMPQVTSRAREFFHKLCKTILSPPDGSKCQSSESTDESYVVSEEESLSEKTNNQTKGRQRITLPFCVCGSPCDKEPDNHKCNSYPTSASVNLASSVDLAMVSMTQTPLERPPPVLPAVSTDSVGEGHEHRREIWESETAAIKQDSILTTQLDSDSAVDDITTESLGTFEHSEADVDNVLIVGHGMWLKQFQGIILSHYKGKKLEGKMAKEVNYIMPNTGVCKFNMVISHATKRIHVHCIDVLMINDISHLQCSHAELAANAKIQGSL